MRKIVALTCVICLLGMSLSSYAQSLKERSTGGLESAKRELQEALNNKSQHNVVADDKLLLRDKVMATQVVEPMLFRIYGKESIIRQRPYEIYLIDHYWVMSGTLPKGQDGGVFLIIVDARNSEIIRLTHGK